MSKEIQKEKPDVVIVGAGPVGLWTAIQLKLINPNTKILMKEKYKEYKRKHVVILNSGSFKHSHQDQRLQNLLMSFTPKKPNTLKKLATSIGIDNDYEAVVRTNVLETKLLNLATSLGIDIDYESVKSCKKLAQQYPSTSLIVGADGSHSSVRKQVFKDEFAQKRNLQYIAELKYHVKGATKPLPLADLQGLFPHFAGCQHLIKEHVGKLREGITAITLRFFIDKQTYKKLQKASFKNPYHYSKDKKKIPSSLVTSIDTWLEKRQKHTNEQIISESDKITVLHLPMYRSKQVIKKLHKKHWVLVGDSALGVPFFKSLNNGLLCGTKLARAIDAFLKGQQLKDEHPSLYTKCISFIVNLISLWPKKSPAALLNGPKLKDEQPSVFTKVISFITNLIPFWSNKSIKPLDSYSQYVMDLGKKEMLTASIKSGAIAFTQRNVKRTNKAIDIFDASKKTLGFSVDQKYSDLSGSCSKHQKQSAKKVNNLRC